MRFVLLDLLMATVDSLSAWEEAAGDRERGLAWRDAVTARMIASGRYVPYRDLVRAEARESGMPPSTPDRLWRAWTAMRPWPDAVALERSGVPFGFVTNTSADLAAEALAGSGLEPRFALSAEEAGWYKPSPHIYRAAIARTGVEASLIRYVAGARYDALGAVGIGLGTVLVRRRELDGALPTSIAVVDSLEDALA